MMFFVLCRRATLAACLLAAVVAADRVRAQDFPAPTPPPPVKMGPHPSADNAARLLTQATFGPTDDLISQVHASGIQAFLDEQFARKPSSYVAYLQRLGVPLDDNRTPLFSMPWWDYAVHAPDQLRQRVAFALSEIMVVSALGPRERTYGLAGYMDVLAQDCFGSFHKLLHDVTLSPEMGYYLNMQGNAAPPAGSGQHPNENYAREVMQLFTVGLDRLNPDGSRQLDADGQPIPTYTQDTVTSFARVFTGWTFAPPDGKPPTWRAKVNWLAPMVAVPGYHDTDAKFLLDGKKIPAGGTAESDLGVALNNLSNHPNVGPFFCRQLIQRLVTSNPSPGYVYRVASVFDDNGAGARGDLQAVVTAILTDYEARNARWAAGPTYGKEREPVVRLASVMRAFRTAPMANTPVAQASGALPLLFTGDALGQAPLRAPSVFNFFQPAYTVAGPIAAQGLVAPEFQITTESTAISSANLMHKLIYDGLVYGGASRATLDLSPLVAVADSPEAVTAYLNRVLMAGGMSPAMQDVVTTAVAAIKPNLPDERARAALEIVATSPEYAIQK